MAVRQHLDTLDTLPFEGGAVIHEEWLRAGLVMCLYRDGGGRMVDMVSGARPTTDTATLVNSTSGPVTDYASTQSTQFAHRPEWATTGAMTLIVGVQVDAFTNYTQFITKEAATTANVTFEFRCGAASPTDGNLALIRASAGGGYTQWASSGASSAAGRYVNAVRADGGDIGAGTTVTMWQNGVSLSVTRSPTGSGNASDTGSAVWVGKRFDAATQLDGRIEFIFLFSQALTNQQVTMLSRSPGLLFARPRAGMIGGATNITLNGVVGNAAASGVLAQVGVSITANGTVGNAVAAGTAAQVGVSTTVNGVVGNAAAAGTTAQVGVAITVNGVVGNATAAGTTAQVGVSTTVDGAVGNATAAGTAAQVGVSTTVNGAVGNATAAGTAAQVGVSTTVNGAVGNATAAGTAAQVGVSTTVDGAVGNATAAGTTAQVGVSTTVNGVVGNATAAGTVADVQLGGTTTINGAVGAAVAAGVLGAPGVAQTINGVAGAAVAAGTHGTTSIDVVLSATTGNAVAAGTAAQVGVSITVDAVPGSAAASGLLGALSLDIVVPGVVAGAVASGTAGDVSLVPSSTASAAEVWSYVLSNGLTAEQTFVAIHSMLSDLHLIHGLKIGSPLTVAPALRSAGAVLQSISQVGDTVTVTRS